MCAHAVDLSPRDDYNLIKCKQFFPRRVKFCHEPHCMWSQHTMHELSMEGKPSPSVYRSMRHMKNVLLHIAECWRLQMAFLHQKSSIIESCTQRALTQIPHRATTETLMSYHNKMDSANAVNLWTQFKQSIL